MSAAHVVLIPSYNTGAMLFETIARVRALGWPVIVVIDGSTDGTGEQLVRTAEDDPALLACIQPRNQGKGAAVLHGLRLARAKGFTHALTMDADGQHSTAHVGEMIAVSLAHPAAMVLGFPLFDESAPRIRIVGHKIANFCTGLVTPGGGIGDSLFGFRVYPIVQLMEVFQSTSGMRRFDFDSEAAIRLRWLGLHPINVATPVRYFHRDEGGVSHFKYVRDNLLLTAMYIRLLVALFAGLWAPRITPAEVGRGYASPPHGSFMTNLRKTAFRGLAHFAGKQVSK
jgi:glycosyltransferase involved in cell wall biosynthesis